MATSLNTLVYGFGPFGQLARNPAEDIVHSLRDLDLRGARLQSEVLPVSYRATRERLEEVMGASRFDLVLGFGVAVGSDEFRVEEVAQNRVDTLMPNVDGALPASELIVTTGSAALPARIETGRLIAALSEIGIPVVASRDAGNYLCNFAFYLVHVPIATRMWG